MSTVSDFPSTRPGGWDDPGATPIPAPLRLYEATVGPQWVDYNGHMSEWCYLLVMGDSSDAFFRYIGIDDAYRAAGQSLYTVETHIRNLDELAEGDRIALTLRVLDADPKRVHLLHEVLAVDLDGGERIVATGEQMLLHVDAIAGRTATMPPTLLERVSALRDAHAVLPRPDYVGRPMGLRRREG